MTGMANQSQQIFVGRLREMSDLRAALDNAISGKGSLVMLAGEPGIGKTRIAEELADQARALGAQVLWGWCYERDGAPPYWPWVQPIKSYVREASPEQLQTLMGPAAADIAELIPEIREKLPDLEPPPALEPQETRFRLFDSISTFLKTWPVPSHWCWSWTTSIGPIPRRCCCWSSWPGSWRTAIYWSSALTAILKSPANIP